MLSLAHVILLFLNFLTISSECPISYPKSPSPVSQLYVVNDTVINQSDLVTLQTLGGTIAKSSSPAIYRVGDPSSSYSTWLADIDSKTDVVLKYDYLDNAKGLINHLITSYDIVIGLAVYSAVDDISLFNVVTYCAGADGVIAVDLASVSQYISDYNLTVLYDGTSEDLPDTLIFSTNFITFQQPSAQLYLIEYSVFSRSPFMAWDSVNRDPSLEELRRKSGGCAAAFGWVGDEGEYVSYLAKYGVFVHASDWAKNMVPLSSVLTNSTNSGLSKYSKSHDDNPFEPNTHTVTFVLTDGDNFQWLLGGFIDESWFGSPDLNSIAMSFTLSPALLSVAPIVQSHMEASSLSMYDATFVAAPSGIGYTYPELLTDEELSTFSEETASSMNTNGMTVLNILAGGDRIDDATLLRSSSPFLDFTNIDAVLYYTYGSGYAGGGGKAIFTESGKPIITARYSLWGDEDNSPMLSNDGMITALQQLPKDSSSSNGYSVIPVHAWSHTVADVKYIMDNIGDGFEFVDASSFVAKFKANVKQ